MRRFAALAGMLVVAVIVVAVIVVGVLVPAAARADTTPITSSGQNLPALSTTARTNAGASLAAGIRSYKASGRYQRDQTSIATDARTYLERWLITCQADPSCTPAAVFDIDDTLVSTYDVYNRHGFAPTPTQVGAASSACAGQTITPVARLLRVAVESGVDVFLLTGRSEDKRANTESCLRGRGITGWTALTMRSTDEESLRAYAYKSRERGRLVAAGYDIAFSIGDQYSDVSGGYLDRGFVLPNPMYAIP
jgi:hypothetical protein